MSYGVVVADVAVVDALALEETLAVVVPAVAEVDVAASEVVAVVVACEVFVVVEVEVDGVVAGLDSWAEAAAFAARNAARTAFSFARVFGPTLPYPSSPGFAIPCFTWERWIAASVRRPNIVVSLPEEPSPEVATLVSSSVFKTTWRSFTSSPLAPTLSARAKVVPTETAAFPLWAWPRADACGEATPALSPKSSFS